MVRSFWRKKNQLSQKASTGSRSLRGLPRFTPRVEGLEERLMLDCQVSNASDSGLGSLRQAIRDLNTGTCQSPITFTGSALTSPILLLTDLDTITVPVTIMGQGNFPNPPLVRIHPDPMGFAFNGLHLTGGDSFIQNITVSGFLGNGIWLDGNNNTVTGSYIGTTDDGMAQQGNEFGIFISSGTNDSIGQIGNNGSNLISGNRTDGLLIQSSGTRIIGNLIGTDRNGTASVGNGLGIAVFTGNNTTIGGTTIGTRNIISGNGNGGGVQISSGGAGNVIHGNYIGTDISGLLPLGNTGPGVEITSGSNANVIGGPSSDESNVISGNVNTGVSISTSNNNLVQGNYIGLTVMGDRPLPNSTGISIAEGSNNTVGGLQDGAHNVISGNSNTGLSLSGTGNQVLGNMIGTDPTGTNSGSTSNGTSLGNAFFGVAVLGGSDNVIGGTQAAARNIISGNRNPEPLLTSGTGLLITGGARNTLVQGNIIGLDNLGTNPLGNDVAGVVIAGGASFNTIGGTVTEMRNIISANRGPNDLGVGISIIGSGTSNNLIANNYIGTDIGGTLAVGGVGGTLLLSNGRGLTISGGASDNVVGNPTPRGVNNQIGRRNIISGNINAGIAIYDRGTSNNFVVDNYIGTQVGGTLALGNGEGVDIFGAASGNRIGGFIRPDPNVGGTTTADIHGNLIAANLREGVRIYDFDTSNNLIQGNLIGVYIDSNNRTQPLGNDIGVSLAGYSSNNYVGGTVLTRHEPPNPDEFLPASNIISGNKTYGVAFFDRRTFANHVESNIIGPDRDGIRPVVDANGNLIQKDGVAFFGGAVNNFLGGTLGGTFAAYTRNIISGNAENGVLINGVDTAGNTIRGNFIGTDISGTSLLQGGISNGLNGIRIYYSAHDNVIGGTVNINDPSEPGPRNVIAGNPNDGILIDSNAHDNKILGNFIGTDPTGLTAFANGANGIELKLAVDNIVPPHDNTIGGTVVGSGNLISGNTLDGILISMGSTNNRIFGNVIGLNRTGLVFIPDFDQSAANPLPNGMNGIHIQDLGSDNNVIGGTITRDVNGNLMDTGLGNAIGFNTQDGVLVDTGIQTTILHNYIARHSAGLGIHLVNGGNNNLANPVSITSATIDTVNGLIHITGFLLPGSWVVGADQIVEFFLNVPASGPDSGEIFLPFNDPNGLVFSIVITPDGTFTGTLDDGSGTGSITLPFPFAFIDGMTLTATFTDSAGNTSPFSNPAFVIPAPTGPSPGSIPGLTPTLLGIGAIVPFDGLPLQGVTFQTSAGPDLGPPALLAGANSLDLLFSDLGQDFRLTTPLQDTAAHASSTQDLARIAPWDFLLDQSLERLGNS